MALARAELSAIIENIKATALQAGVALGAGISALVLVGVGTPLFLGEWLFGSLGWGVVLGVTLSLAVIAACVGLILAERASAIAGRAAAAIVLGIILGIVFGLSLTNAFWANVTDRLDVGIVEAWRLLAVAVGLSAIGGAIIGAFVGGVRGGAAGMIGGLVAGTFVGVLVGAFTAISFGPRVGAALGVWAALLAFIGLVLDGIRRRGVDAATFKARFYPSQTIETTKETIEWLKEQGPLGPKS